MLQYRRFLAGLLTGALAVSLAACGQGGNTGAGTTGETTGTAGALGRYVETSYTTALTGMTDLWGLRSDETGNAAFYAELNGSIQHCEALPDGTATAETVPWADDLTSGTLLGKNAFENSADAVSPPSCVTQDAIYTADSTGIYRQVLEGDKWEQIMGATGTSLGAPANTAAARTC